MRVYLLTVLIVDHDRLGPKEAGVVLENGRFPNRCISPAVMATESYEIGEWDERCPLNLIGATADEQLAWLNAHGCKEPR